MFLWLWVCWYVTWFMTYSCKSWSFCLALVYDAVWSQSLLSSYDNWLHSCQCQCSDKCKDNWRWNVNAAYMTLRLVTRTTSQSQKWQLIAQDNGIIVHFVAIHWTITGLPLVPRCPKALVLKGERNCFFTWQLNLCIYTARIYMAFMSTVYAL